MKIFNSLYDKPKLVWLVAKDNGLYVITPKNFLFLLNNSNTKSTNNKIISWIIFLGKPF